MDIQFKYELLERKIFKSTLVPYQDMDAEPCKNYELKGGLNQLINEMNQELTKLGYRVQRGKVNRQYFMEKYCYGNEVRKEV